MTIKERIAIYKKTFNNMTDRQQNIRYASAIFVGVVLYAILCAAWNGFLLLIPLALVFLVAYGIVVAVRD